MQTKPETGGVQHLPDHDFRLRIITTNPAHIQRSLCFIEKIQHAEKPAHATPQRKPQNTYNPLTTRLKPSFIITIHVFLTDVFQVKGNIIR
jgi:hypothetical protein